VCVATLTGRLFPPATWSPVTSSASVWRHHPGGPKTPHGRVECGPVRRSPVNRKTQTKRPAKCFRRGLSSGAAKGNGVVMLTGAKTYFGRTTELVQEARPKLHIEAVVAKIVRWLFVIVGALLGVVIVLSVIRHVPLMEMVRSCSSCS